MKVIIDRHADRSEYDEDLRAEMKEQVRNELSKVCPLEELDDFEEWVNDEGYQMYCGEYWTTNGRKIKSTIDIYKEFANLDNYELWQLGKYGKVISRSHNPEENDGIIELNRLSEYFETQLLKDHP